MQGHIQMLLNLLGCGQSDMSNVLKSNQMNNYISIYVVTCGGHGKVSLTLKAASEECWMTYLFYIQFEVGHVQLNIAFNELHVHFC